MKKILLYTDAPYAGGAETQMFLLAKFLDKKKYFPMLAVSKNSSLDSLCDNFKKENIPVVRLDVIHKHNPKNYFEIKKILKDEKIDILHINLWNPASGRYAFMAGKSAGIPIIVTEHDPFQLPYFKNFLKKYFLKNVSKIVAISNANKKTLAELFPQYKNKISVIHNGIDLTWWQSQFLRFGNDDWKNIKKNIFKTHESTLIILSIAELHERKGLKYLIEAFPEIAKKYPNVKLAIVGEEFAPPRRGSLLKLGSPSASLEGGERNNLENLIKKLDIENRVILLGRRKEIPRILKSSNIFVLPSVREGFGLVNLEAMACPLPVVATKAGGIPEIVVDGETGFLVEPKNPHAIFKALDKLISDPNLRIKMGENGLTRVRKSFDAKKMAEEYEKIYSTLARNIL